MAITGVEGNNEGTRRMCNDGRKIQGRVHMTI
jgi:hypothetical protein